MSVLGNEMRFLILNRVAKRRFFLFKQDGSTPIPKLPFRVPPLPHHPLPQGIYFNITRPNILYAVIKF